MSQKEIIRKVVELVREIEFFSERDVVYILVETYKIKERDLESVRKEIKRVLPHIAFFRDWVVHTHISDNLWIEQQGTLNDTGKLLSEILSLVEDSYTKDKIQTMWSSFESSLRMITKDQEIG